MNKDFYNISAQRLRGEEEKMENYAGKVILIVNTASKCGLTYQYAWLEKLYQKYKDRGLVILWFPCNQFANQEPWDSKAIEQWCLINYGVTFPMFAKVDVNGKNTHPLFEYLKNSVFNLFGKNIKWNFTKFLVDKNGNPVKRFAPMVKPEKLEKAIEKML